MKYPVALLTFSISTILVGCGGGSGDTSVAASPVAVVAPEVTPKKPLTVSTSGIISGFGSIVVNGVHYETNTSAISTDDGLQITEQELAIGMMVELEGTLSDDGLSGQAKTVKYTTHLEGPVSFIDLANNQLTLLGKVIEVDDLTVYEHATLNALKVGDRLEVSGYITAQGRFYASRIELKTQQTTAFKIYGNVSQLDIAAQTFRLGELLVQYSNARFDDFNQVQLSNGQTVKVKGQLFDSSTTSLVATEVDLEKSPSKATADKMWQEGVVSDYQPGISLMLNGQTYLLGADTRYEYGQSSQLENGVRIKLQAILGANGWKVEEISFVQQAVVKLSGKISALDLTKNSFVIDNTTFLVTPETLLKDDSNRAIRYFDLKSLVIGDYLEVAAFHNAEGGLVALKIEREEGSRSDNTIELKGLPSEITADSFMLFGHTIVTESSTRYESDDTILSKSQFFALLTTTTVVEVQAIVSGNDLLAMKLELVTKQSRPDDHSPGKVEFKGVVSAKNTLQIVVNDYTVNLSNDTKLKIGKSKNMTPANFIAALALGEKVKVEGMVDANKVVNATEIEAERDDD